MSSGASCGENGCLLISAPCEHRSTSGSGLHAGRCTDRGISLIYFVSLLSWDKVDKLETILKFYPYGSLSESVLHSETDTVHSLSAIKSLDPGKFDCPDSQGFMRGSLSQELCISSHPPIKAIDFYVCWLLGVFVHCSICHYPDISPMNLFNTPTAWL